MEQRRVVQKTSPAMGPGATFLTVLLILIIIAATFVAGYYVGNNFNIDLKAGAIEKTNKSGKDDNKTKITDYNVTDSKVANLIPNLVKGYGTDCWAIEDFTNDRKITVNEISNHRAFAIAEYNKYYTGGNETVSVDEATDEIRKYLGKDFQFVASMVKYDEDSCTNYEYDPDKKQFNRKDNDCEGFCPEGRTVYKVIKAVDVDGTLTIYVKVLFGKKDDYKFYSDFGRNNLITDSSEYVSSAVYKGSDYKFTFKLEDDRYVFVSSEPIKY